MDFLPKRNDRPGATHRPPGMGAPHRGASVTVESSRHSLNSNPAISHFVRSPVRAWVVFTPSVLLIIALIATFRTGGLEAKSCAIAIGMVLTLHNVGSFLQNLLDRTLPGVGGLALIVRGCLPLLGLLGLFLWLQPASTSGFYNETIQLGVLTVAFAVLSRLAGLFLLRRFGPSWPRAIQVACCIYLAILYAGVFMLKVPGLEMSAEAVLALIVVLAVFLRIWSTDASMMPIQVVSVTYTLALWDTKADAERLANTLSVSFALLFLLIAVAVIANGVLRIGKN